MARAIAKGAYHAVRQGEDFEDVLCEALESGKKELARTPELLPALKAAGVVDAGGQGLIVFLEGCLAGFRGEDAGELHLPPSKPSFANFIEMEVQNLSLRKLKSKRTLYAVRSSLWVIR